MGIIGRLGVFFLWIGGILILLFFFSSQADSANFNLFVTGFLLLLFGTILRVRGRPQSGQSTRFRIFRKRTKQADGDRSESSGGDQRSPKGPPL